MKKFGRELARALFDLRVITGLSGILLSIAAHELFHIIIHWGEIDSVHILPDSQAIVEVIFTPSAHYNLALEEGIAYLITMITLLLTAMLIGDIHDAKNTQPAHHVVLDSDFENVCTDGDTRLAQEQLARILGIEPAR